MEDNNFASNTVGFEIDTSGTQLGPKPPKKISEDARRAESLEFRNWGVRADVIGVHRGFHEGKAACLVVFRFRFNFNDKAKSSSRFSNARIVANFEPHSTGTTIEKNVQYPVVKTVCPRLIEGPVTIKRHANTTSVQMSIHSPPITGISAGVGLTRSLGVEYVVGHRLSVKGIPWGDKDLPDDNAARWTLTENSEIGDGIPVEFRTAVLIENQNQAFRGTLKIHATTKLGLRIFGWPWSAPSPLIFNPDVSFGEKLSPEFDSMSEETWARLCEFHGPISVRNDFKYGESCTHINDTVISMDRQVFCHDAKSCRRAITKIWCHHGSK